MAFPVSSLCTPKALLHSLAPRTGTSLLLFPTAGQFLGIFSHPNVVTAASEATAPLSVPLPLLVCSWLCGLSLLFTSWILFTPPITIKIKDGVAEGPRLILPHQGAAQKRPGLQESIPTAMSHSITFQGTEKTFCTHHRLFLFGYRGKSLPSGLGEVAAKVYRAF